MSIFSFFKSLRPCALVVGVAAAWCGSAQGQVLDDPITVPVVFRAEYDATGNSTLSITNGDGHTASGSGTGSAKLTNATFSNLRPGKVYVFTATYKLASRIAFRMSPPAGYRVFINGIDREMMEQTVTSSGSTQTLKYYVRIDSGSGAPVGEATSIRPVRVVWSVGLGNLRNGKPAGLISIAENGLTSNTFSPLGLIYDRDSTLASPSIGDDGEVIVVKVGGVLRQVYSAGTIVDIVSDNDHVMRLLFYSTTTATIGSPDSYGVYPITGTPLYEYRVDNTSYPALTELYITKTTNQNGTLVQWTKMTKQTGQPTGTNQWVVQDWADNTVTTSPVQQRWTYTNNDLNELLEVMNSSNVVQHQVSKTYQDINFGETSRELVSETVGSGTTAVTTSYTYYTSLPSAGSWHKVKSITTNDGSWSANDYFDDFRTCGRLRQVRRPFKNAPASDPGTDAASGEVTTYTYGFQDYFGTKRLPTVIEVKVNGNATSRTETDYSYENVTDTSTGSTITLPVTVATQRAFYGTGSYYTSYIKTYREDADTAYHFFPGLLRSIERPDSTYTLNLYSRGSFVGVAYSPSPSGEARTIYSVSGTNNSSGGSSFSAPAYSQSIPTNFYVIDGKSTQGITYMSGWGPVYLQQGNIYIGSQWVATNQDWNHYTSGEFISSVDRRSSDVGGFWTPVSNTWTAGRLSSSTGETGIVQNYTYDAAGRLETIVRTSATGAGTTVPSQTTTIGYDSAGRTTSQTVSGGGESVGTTATYDLAGRPLTTTSSGVNSTNYAYNVGSRTTTVTLPSTFTKVETRYMDGQVQSVTGTGVVAQYIDYSVGVDGKRYTKTSIGSSTSARIQEVWSDWLGRTVSNSRPGFTGQAAFTETMTYDSSTSQLKKVVRTGYADTLYEYNSMGERTRTALDVSGGGVQLASTDRVTDSDTTFESYAGAYWLKSTTTGYPFATGTSKVLGIARKRLTGLSSTLRAEDRSTDAEGNENIQTVEVDQSAKLVTATTIRPGMASNQIEKLLNGLSVSVTSHDGLTVGQDYDALGRPTTTREPRTGTTTRSYHANTTFLKEVTDAANKRLQQVWYDTSGRPSVTYDAYSKASRVSYNTLGQLEYQWGSAATPCMYVYNSYGERTKLRTYRDTSVNWDAAQWPGGANYDETQWLYDDPSGLLTKKTDAANKSVDYTYNLRGQTYQRTWARTYNGTRVVTTYGYDGSTGELTSVSYNDGTPAVGYSYTRLGQIYSATDAITGAHDFVYDPTSPWRLASEGFGPFYSNRVLSFNYEASTSTNTSDSSYTGHTIGSVKGRLTGYRLGTVGTPANDLEQIYAISNAGRIAGLKANRSNGAAITQFVYGYESNSSLLKTMSVVGNAFFVDRSYEPNRNLLTRIETKWNTTTRTKFDYAYDDRRQRQSVVQSGDVFADYGDSIHQIYGYSDRGEVTAAATYMGAAPTSQTSPMAGRKHEFSYDSAGNRNWSNTSGVTALRDNYVPNNLNQYISKENNTLAVGGTANASARVAAGSSPAALAGRAANYWGDNITVDNATKPFRGSVPFYAAIPGGGANGKDLIWSSSKTGFLAAAAQSFSYDEDGNVTSDGVWNYQWDAENRLILQTPTTLAVQGGMQNRALEFRYDYQNRRVKKRVLDASNGNPISEQRFVYSGPNLIAELDGSGNLQKSYFWGLDIASSLSATGGVGSLILIADYAQSKTLFPAYDGNGNVAAVLNAYTSTTEAAYEYSPFGELLRCEGAYATSNPFRFSTKFTDDESGLVYYGARYYSPSWGRFINRDPIAERGGLNLYGFCGNDGVNGVDYLGYKNFLSKFWNKYRHKIISTVIRVVGDYLGGWGEYASAAYDTAVGYHYGGAKGAIIAYAGSGYGGTYAQYASTTYSTYQQFNHGKFINNLGNYFQDYAVSYGIQTAAYGTVNGIRSARTGGTFTEGFGNYARLQYYSEKQRWVNLGQQAYSVMMDGRMLKRVGLGFAAGDPRFIEYVEDEPVAQQRSGLADLSAADYEAARRSRDYWSAKSGRDISLFNAINKSWNRNLGGLARNIDRGATILTTAIVAAPALAAGGGALVEFGSTAVQAGRIAVPIVAGEIGEIASGAYVRAMVAAASPAGKWLIERSADFIGAWDEQTNGVYTRPDNWTSVATQGLGLFVKDKTSDD